MGPDESDGRASQREKKCEEREKGGKSEGFSKPPMGETPPQNISGCKIAVAV